MRRIPQMKDVNFLMLRGNGLNETSVQVTLKTKDSKLQKYCNYQPINGQTWLNSEVLFYKCLGQFDFMQVLWIDSSANITELNIL